MYYPSNKALRDRNPYRFYWKYRPVQRDLWTVPAAWHSNQECRKTARAHAFAIDWGRLIAWVLLSLFLGIGFLADVTGSSR